MGNLLYPLRKIVRRFVDREGPMQQLECGHYVADKPRVTSRRCTSCVRVSGPAIVPVGPVALRQWMVERYGWPDRTIKDISKLRVWRIDQLKDERKHEYSTDCQLSVQVVDDLQLLLRLGNKNIQARLEPVLSTMSMIEGSILVNVPSPIALHLLAEAIERMTSVAYDIPSFKYVCPRTAHRLREFALELGTYRASDNH